jgi:glutathione S-transferase
VLRLYDVLEIRLSGRYSGGTREYLAGQGKGKYSIADINAWPWVRNIRRIGFSEDELAQFPHLQQWVNLIAA